MTGVEATVAATLLTAIGVFDLVIALIILVRPIRAAPLALLYLIGWPQNWKEWWK